MRSWRCSRPGGFHHGTDLDPAADPHHRAAQRVLAAVTFRPGRTYRVVPTRANGQPAFGLYLADPHASVYRAYSLLVITTAGDHITVITGFSTNVMTRFGLPRTLPETD